MFIHHWVPNCHPQIISQNLTSLFFILHLTSDGWRLASPPPHAGAPCLPSFLYGHDPNLLADDTALFSTVKVPKRTSNNLSNDLKKINKRAFQWKMTFKPDPTKQAQMVIFSWKTTKKTHPKIFINNISVSKADSQKHLGLHLDSK